MEQSGIRLLLAVAMIFMILVLDFVRNKKLAVVAFKWFSALLGLVGISIVFDLISISLGGQPGCEMNWFEQAVFRIYFVALDLMVVTFYIYAKMTVSPGPFSLQIWWKRLILAGVILVITCIAPISYAEHGGITFVKGIPAFGVQLLSLGYVVPFLIQSCLRHPEEADEYQTGIKAGTFVWMGLITFQFLFPWLHLNSMAQVMTMFIIYLSFGSPKSFKDDSTEAFNRRAFDLVLDGLLCEGKCFCVVSVTFENYARTNSRFGYEVGDKVLKTIMRRMFSLSGPRIYRISADTVSFIIYSSHLAPKKRNFMMEILGKEFTIGRDTIVTKIHVDVIEDAQHLEKRDEILDMIHYMSTHESSDNEPLSLCMFNDSIQRARKRDAQIEEILLEAIKHDGFEMFYQPILSTQKGTFVSAEALIRLKSTKELGNISPEEYIPIAEKKGLINEIGRIVMEKVCLFIRSARLKEKGVEYIEVNLSGIQCVNQRLPQQIKEILDKYVLSAERINLEITETTMVESGDLLLRNMKELRAMGFTFSMDDFGTGYSNLAQMLAVGYELVKLDKSLLWSCFQGGQREKALIVLQCVTDMIHRIGSKIVAEGVETKEQAQLLDSLGVEYHQGYYYSKPMNEKEYLEFLKKNEVKHE